MKKRIIKGFTLIELLVVISIIGMIVAFAMFGMQGAFEASRDTNRKSDLQQYESALEIYANNNGGFYPVMTGTGTDISALCGSGYLDLASNCIDDPESDTGVSYQYTSDASGVNYAIWAQLEGDDENVWMVCSGGLVGLAGQDSLDGVCMVGSVAEDPDPEDPGGDGICSVGGIGNNACETECLADGSTVGGYCDLSGNCICLDGAELLSCVATDCVIDCITLGFDSGSCQWPGGDSINLSCVCSGGGPGNETECDPPCAANETCDVPTNTCSPVNEPECVDSDNGSFPAVAGYVIDVSGTRTYDDCTGGSSIVEQTCGNGGNAVGTEISCGGGICRISRGGDFCYDSAPQVCEDTDGGLVPDVGGSVTDSTGRTYSDYCISVSEVIEIGCSEAGTAFSMGFTCDDGMECVGSTAGAYCTPTTQ